MQSLALVKFRPILLLTVLALPISASAQYVFNRADFATGGQPTDVAIADFNDDGQQDLAVANNGDATVSILLGKPDGTFAVKVDYATSGRPFQVVAADLNKDGKTDLVVAGFSEDVVSILLGHGDGTFAAHADYATAHFPVGVAVGDFNHDGQLDLAVLASNCDNINCFPSSVSVLLGNADGSFQGKTDYEVGLSPNTIITEDFNGDGELDLAVTNFGSDTISILLGKGDGKFQNGVTYPTETEPWGIAAADFDGDHIIDLVVTHGGTPGDITLLKGRGDGSFAAETAIRQVISATNVKVADLNGDGKMDFVTSVINVGGEQVFLGNGNGTFQTPSTHSAALYPIGFAIQDVSGDGLPDLVIAAEEADLVTVLLGNGDGTFSPRRNLPIAQTDPSQLFPINPVISDLNNDGIPDLAIGEGTAGAVSVSIGKGKGLFQPPVLSNAGISFAYMASADFNGDGFPDLAITGFNGLKVMLGNGDGTFAAASGTTSTLAVTRGLVTGDFNNDGKQDVAIISNGFLQTKPLYIFLGNGDGTFQSGRQFWDLNTVPVAIVAADFNGDGKLDLALSVNPDGVAIMLGDGAGNVGAPVMFASNDLYGGFNVADLNGDGIPDFFVAGETTLGVFIGKGDGTFKPRVDYDGGSFLWNTIAGDFNGDGKIDVAIQATGFAGELELLLGKGDGTFLSRVEIADDAQLGGILAVGDLNQDGTSDLVVGGSLGALFMSVPHATFSPARLDFGGVGIGSAKERDITLTNYGNGPLELTNVTLTGVFTLSDQCGASLSAGASCALGVSFAPSSLVSSTGLVTIADNAPLLHHTIPLSGSGRADFSIVVASGSSDAATVTAGNAASYTLTVTPLGSFAQNVTLACAGAPATSSCTLTPTSAPLDGANPANVTVKVTTTPRAVASNSSAPSSLLFSVLLAPLGVLISLGNSGPRRRHIFWLVFAVGLLILSAASCGGGGSPSSGGPGGGTSGTPAGSYTLTVTGTSGSGDSMTQHSVGLTLKVD